MIREGSDRDLYWRKSTRTTQELVGRPQGWVSLTDVGMIFWGGYPGGVSLFGTRSHCQFCWTGSEVSEMHDSLIGLGCFC